MSDDGNWWDPYCPCKITRKNIVMAILALCCMALVTWTVVVTAKNPSPLNGGPSNVTYVYIDDSKDIGNLNITMNSVLKKDKATNAIKKALKKAEDKNPMPSLPVTVLKHLKKSEDEELCKCLCAKDVQEQDMINALEYMKNPN